MWHHSEDRTSAAADFLQFSSLPGAGGSERQGLRSRVNGGTATTPLKSSTAVPPMGPHSLQDGMLEVVAVRGAFHLGQLQAGLDRPIKICQCRSACLRTRGSFPMQLDGEPWLQGPCELKVEKKTDPVYFLKKSTSPVGKLAAEVNSLFEWASSTGVISKAVEEKLTLEFSRRLDSKSMIS